MPTATATQVPEFAGTPASVTYNPPSGPNARPRGESRPDITCVIVCASAERQKTARIENRPHEVIIFRLVERIIRSFFLVSRNHYPLSSDREQARQIADRPRALDSDGHSVAAAAVT